MLKNQATRIFWYGGILGVATNRTLLAAKVNLDVLEHRGQQYGYPDPRARLKWFTDAIRASEPIKLAKHKDVRWRFASVTPIELPSDVIYLMADSIMWGAAMTESVFDPNKLVYGRLCKVKDRVFERAHEAQEPVQEIEKDLVIADAYFAFHPVSEIILFEDRTPDISPETFVRNFRKLCTHLETVVGDVVITILPDSVELRSKLRGFAKITAVEFSIVHGNWFWSKWVNDLDKALKEAGAREAKARLANPKGLKVDGEFTQDALEMVDKGYGHVEAKGFDQDGKRHKVNSQEVYLKRSAAMETHEDRVEQFSRFLERVLEKRKGG